MQDEQSAIAEIRAQLNDLGFQFVQTERRISGNSHLRADLVAWASNSDGDLVPWVAIEVKNGAKAHKDLSLQALIRARDTIGTVDHYAVVNGQWFKADRALRRMEPVDGPSAPEFGTDGWLRDDEVAASLILDALADEERKSFRSDGPRIDWFFPPSNVFAETALPGIELADGGFVPVDSPVLWEARREALVQWLARRGKSGSSSTSDPVIARAVAQLAGSHLEGVVLDPFCGTGSFIWEAVERTKGTDASIQFIGFEVNHRLADIAAEIGRSAPLWTVVENGDSFRVGLPEADAVLAAPPAGLKVQEPWHLSSGRPTKAGDLAAIDLCIRQLKPGGRAVLHLPVSVTFRNDGEAFRHYLANEFRVAAIIGLPSGAMADTHIRSVLLVIDRTEPGDTFIAQLSEDWEAQLAEDGAAMMAALLHLDDLGRG